MTRLRFSVAMGLLLAPLAASCAPYLPLEGVVVDTTTGKSIPETFVISEWTVRSGDLVGSRTSCPKVDVVKTDDQGRYRFSGGFTTTLFGGERLVFAYKAGYALDLSRPMNKGLISMKPFVGTGDERARSFDTFESLLTCGSRAEIAKVLSPLYTALDQEAATLLVTSQQTARPGGFMSSLRRHERAIAAERDFDQQQRKKGR